MTDQPGKSGRTAPEIIREINGQIIRETTIDYDHQTQFVPQTGRAAPAAGWIKRLFARAGAVWGEVQWTDRGRAAVESGEYRFISPTFLYEKASRKVTRITGAGLVNSPAFFMEAIASAQTMEDSMNLEKLRKALGLAKDATEEQILAAASAAAASHTAIAAAAKAFGLEDGSTGEQVTAAATASVAGMTAIAKAAGLEEAAKPDAIATAVAAARAGTGGGDPDPEKFVPRSEFNALSERLKGIETAGAEATATAAVDAAVRAGKVTPGQRDWALGYARKDLAGFQAYAEAAPAIVEPGPADGRSPSALRSRRRAHEGRARRLPRDGHQARRLQGHPQGDGRSRGGRVMALSADRRTPRYQTPDGPSARYKLKASTTIYAGSMVMLDADGLAVSATKAANHVPVGRAEHAAKSGASDDVYVECRQGVFRWKNGAAAANAIRAQEIGDKVYVEDDETVRRDQNSNGVVVGRAVALDDVGVWVATGFLYGV